MRGYEAIFIFRPSLNEEERMKHVEKIEKIISAKGVLHESNYWGRKRFAYPIQRFTDGHFYLFIFDSEATIPYELKRLTKITETILRSLIIVRETAYHAKEEPHQAPISPIPVETIVPEVLIEKESVETDVPVEVIELVKEVVPEQEDTVEEVKNEDTNAE